MTTLSNIQKSAFTILIIGLALAVIWIGQPLVADDKGGCCPYGCEPGKFEMATATGVNHCVPCALKKELGAASACKVYGHQHALKIEKVVDACGEEKPDFAGKTLFYLENDKSTELIKGHHGENLTVKGKVYVEVPMIEVESFEVVEVPKAEESEQEY